MAITYGFFNSVDGDRTYNAEDMSSYFEGLVSDGVYASVDDALIVLAAGSGLGITVGTGRAIVKMHWLRNSAALPLELSPADVQYDRIDVVVLRCDLTESGRAVSIEIKEGTPAESPAAAALEDSETMKELALAFIRVKKGATTLYQSNISDVRGSTFCGWVTGLVKQVDTSELFLQWQTAYENYYAESTAAFDAYFAEKQTQFESWFAALTQTLGVNTTIKKYQSVNVPQISVISYPLSIPEYETGDLLLVHVDGVFFAEGEEYTINGSGDRAQIHFNRTITKGSTITSICIKSEIGSASGIAIAAMTEEEYAAIEEPDDSILYVLT